MSWSESESGGVRRNNAVSVNLRVWAVDKVVEVAGLAAGSISRDAANPSWDEVSKSEVLGITR